MLRFVFPWVLAVLVSGCARAAPVHSAPTTSGGGAASGSSTSSSGSASAPSPPPGTCPPLPRVADAPAVQLIATYGTKLDAYQVEGGTWLSIPVLVNEDFDFASAMALEGIGPAIAAGKRKTDNEQKAKSLAQASFGVDTLAALDALRASGSHGFFVLWGSEQAVLKLVIEPDAACAGHSPPRVLESQARPLSGEQGWGAPSVLDAEAKVLLETSSHAEPRLDTAR